MLVDEYAPLTIVFKGGEQNEIYLRFVSDYSLLELGLSTRDGVLTSLKLVQVNGLSGMEIPSLPTIVEEGLPLFDVAQWKGNRLVDINCPVELVLSGSSALIVIDKSRKADKLLRYENFGLAVSEGYPCWVLLKGLAIEQIEGIKRSVQQSAGGGFL
jgi:hypothetical protein